MHSSENENAQKFHRAITANDLKDNLPTKQQKALTEKGA
jgi:hypothetical protein